MRLLIIISILLWPFPATAEFSREAYEHARSAFLFIGRGEWEDARLHAERTENPLFIKLIDWQYLLDPDSLAGFYEITSFIRENLTWPEQKKLLIRAELSLRDSNVGDEDILSWFEQNPPITGVGKVTLAETLLRQPNHNESHVEHLLREAWIKGDFDEDQEEEILGKHRTLFSAEDHEERVNRLLWEDKPGGAKRMFPYLSSDKQLLVKARLALMENKRTAALAITQVPASLRHDPGLIYDRMRYRARHDDDSGVRDMLLAAPGDVPYPEKWWKIRELQVRKAIDEKNYVLAEKLLQNHGQMDGNELADATWLRGWLQLEFLHQAPAAYQNFITMYEEVKFPVSKARAAYWAARTAEVLGDQAGRKRWYEIAGNYPSTFYGQLALTTVAGASPLRLPAEPEMDATARQSFEAQELVQAALLCKWLDEMDLAGKLVDHLIETAKTREEIILAAQVGTTVNKGVHSAKKALQKNEFLLATGYPRLKKIPDEVIIEEPLVLAIMRQESEFDPQAKSPSGAIGMMQLLPSTARETARKLGVGYNISRLYEENYNITLGSHYLERLIDSYNGSYILGIAAYNAGPGNVRKWVSQFGLPGNTPKEAINWIEKIPFSETRNYVQRVLENLQVYRHLLDAEAKQELVLVEDMTR